jgi:hypothetical protein
MQRKVLPQRGVGFMINSVDYIQCLLFLNCFLGLLCLVSLHVKHTAFSLRIYAITCDQMHKAISLFAKYTAEWCHCDEE